MKKQISLTVIFLGLFVSSNLLAIEPTPPTHEEYKEIVDSFKLKDTSKKELSQTFRVNGNILKSELEKTRQDNNGIYFKNGVYIQHLIIYETKFSEPEYWLGISLYDNKFFSVACSKTDKTIIISSIVRYSSYNKHKKQKKVEYTGFVASFDKNTKRVNYDIDGGLSNELNNSYTSIPIYNPKEFYPYFKELRILSRLYETGTCDKKATEEANIEVLVKDKWIPQEQSWNIMTLENKNQ